MDVSKLYSTTDLTRKGITACGETFDVFVRRLPVVDLRKFQFETHSADPEVVATAGFNALVKSIRQEDGKPFATFEQYRKMDGEAIGALMRVFSEVNTAKRDADLGND